MSRNIIWGFLLIVILYHGTNAKLCDIKKWYKGLQSDNGIVSNLSLDQEELIEKIEKKIRNSKFSGNGKINCDILDEYEKILSTDPNRHKRKAPTKIKTFEKDTGRTRDNVKYKRKSNDDEDDDDIPKRNSKKYTNSKKKEIDEDDEDVSKRKSKQYKGSKNKDNDGEDEDVPKKKGTEDTNRKKKENDEEDEDIPKRKSNSKNDISSKKENDEDDDAIENDRKDHALKEDDEKSEIIQSKNENEQPPEPVAIEEHKDYDPTESDVDETELLEEELPISIEKVKEESIGITDNKESSYEMTDEKVALHQREEHNASKDEPSARLPRLNKVCSKYINKCSRLCYYRYQNQQSPLQYPSLHQNNTQSKPHPANLMQVTEKPNQKSSKASSDSDIKTVKLSQEDSDDDQIGDGNSSTGSKDKQPEANSTDEQQDVSGTADKQTEVNDTVDKQQIVKEDLEEKDTVQKKDDKQQKNKSDSDDNTNNKETQRDSKMNSSDQPNLNNIDILIQQRATEYSTRISQLEILLMKLENKFLNQQLHKQNNSNSFSKLEFQIVKLENELLKLNQSYYKLSSENQILRHQERLRSKSYAALPEGNSTKHTELITQQQVKISQLTDWLTNQTTNLNQLRDKSDSLASQNQVLYQIVMNQTALISNIMQKVQDLSDENLSYRKETQDLKSKINSNDASVKILEKLESLGSKTDAVDVNQQQKLKQFHFLPDVPEAFINRHLWKCNGLMSPQICYKYSILLSPCPPFSTVYWRKCPKYIYEKTASFFMEFLKEFPNGTETVKLEDNKENITQKPIDPKVRSGKKQPIPKPEAVNDQTKEAKESQENKKDIRKEDAQHEEDKKRKGKNEAKKEGEKKEKEKEEKKNEEDDKKEEEDKKEEVQKKVEEQEQVLVKDDEDEDDKGETGRPIKYTSLSLKKPKDCYEVYQRGSVRSGVYKIFLPGLKYYVDVYCDMKNGGWTLIQKRDSGEVDFFKDWKAYKEGFGVNTGEHYLGNDFIHFLTNQGHYSLHVELVNWKKEKRQAIYKDFWIDEEADGYKLHIEGYDGDAGDGLTKHNEMKFSTHDVDNDKVIKEFGGSCSKRFHGAGWYFKCYSSNLNGQYYDNGVVPPKKFDGVAWKPWTGPNYSLKEIVLKVRPKDVL